MGLGLSPLVVGASILVCVEQKYFGQPVPYAEAKKGGKNGEKWGFCVVFLLSENLAQTPIFFKQK